MFGLQAKMRFVARFEKQLNLYHLMNNLN